MTQRRLKQTKTLPPALASDNLTRTRLLQVEAELQRALLRTQMDQLRHQRLGGALAKLPALVLTRYLARRQPWLMAGWWLVRSLKGLPIQRAGPRPTARQRRVRLPPATR